MAADLSDSPWPPFMAWWQDAHGEASIRYPQAFTLATVDQDGVPDARIVLAHRIDEGRGLLFSTDEDSAKACQLRHHAHAAAVFHWDALERQVRWRGLVMDATTDEADFCFEERPRKSRLTAWACRQSATLHDFADLQSSWEKAERRFEDRETIPRPEKWRAYVLVPQHVELWQAAAKRLHERRQWTRDDKGRWQPRRLWP